MAFAEEGAGFTTEHLRQLWRSHTMKLNAVYDFLVEERYWFDVEPPDPSVNAAALGAVQGWARRHNADKQRGFYVDVRPDGEAHGPETVDVDATSLREIVNRIHQIGWQLRLGEHIEWRGQQSLAAVDDRHSDAEGLRPRNVAYGFTPDGAGRLGQTGYEAMTREVEALRDDG
jgi:AbiV family abortive infection protein